MATTAPRPRRSAVQLTIALAVVGLLTLFGVTADARAAQLTTQFNANNGQKGNTFDLQVGPGGVTIWRLDLNATGPPGPVELWTREGTSVGFEGSQAGWSPRGTANVNPAGLNLPTPFPIEFSLPPGAHGVAVGMTNGGILEYTNGPPTLFPGLDGNLNLTSRNGLGPPLLAGGGIFNDRIWNGTIHYRTPSDECADARKRYDRAKKKAKKAKKKLRKAKRRYGTSSSKYKKAKRKYKKAKRDLKRSRRIRARACN